MASLIPNLRRRSVDAHVPEDLGGLEVALAEVAQVAVLGEPLEVVVVFEEVTPLVLAAGELEVAAVVLQNSVHFHKGTANMACYRTPVASHFGANRTPVLQHRTQQANN